MYKPLIILDIDGVLNSEKYASSFTKSEWIKLTYFERHLDNEAVKLINYICDNTNAQVVISSTWRLGRSVDELQEILSSRGATFKVLDKTINYDIMYRGYEIDEWICRNRSKDKNGNYFNFTNYAILDDDVGDMLIKQKDNIFEIDYKVGITKEIADKVIEFLKLR